MIHAVERSHQEQHTILRTDSGNGHGTRHGYRRDVQLRTDIRKRFLCHQHRYTLPAVLCLVAHIRRRTPSPLYPYAGRYIRHGRRQSHGLAEVLQGNPEVGGQYFFIPYYEQTYDTLTFGKYRGKRIAEVYYIDPNYVLWMANRFEPEKKKLLKLKETAQCFAVVHAELSPPRRPAYRSPSRYVGEKGEKLEALRLKILYVKQQVDTYKPDFYIDQRILAADSQGNRYTFTEKAAGRSQTPKALSCFSRQLSPGMEITLSARVMGHYESQGVKYTRLGYVKYG